MRFNPSKVEVVDSNPVPKGEYELILTDYEHKTANSGTEIVKCKFSMLHPDMRNRKIRDDFFLTSPSFWKIKLLALATKYPQADADVDVEVDDIFQHALKQSFLASVEIKKEFSTDGVEYVKNVIAKYHVQKQNESGLKPVTGETDNDMPF